MTAKWFGVSLLFEATHDDDVLPTSLWEERVVLIQADSEAKALDRAEDIGREQEHQYVVAAPRPHILRWRYVRTQAVYEILSDRIEDGTEVFSRLLRREAVHTQGEPDSEQ